MSPDRRKPGAGAALAASLAFLLAASSAPPAPEERPPPADTAPEGTREVAVPRRSREEGESESEAAREGGGLEPKQVTGGKGPESAPGGGVLDLEQVEGEPGPESAPGSGVLDLEQVDVAAARRFQFHGRADIAYIHFESTDNVDNFRRDQVLPISPAIYAELRLLDWLFIVGEVEYDGREETLEIDQAVFRIDALEDLLTLRIGRYYFPFGLEKEYYSPVRNLLVDRPAAFRQVYPGTYADNGLFVEGKYIHPLAWTLGYEAAVTQGLQGFDREDLPRTLRDNNDSPQAGGRVYFKPRPELSVGVSYTLGIYDDDDREALDFFGVDGELKLLDFRMRAEYVGGRVEGTEEFGTFFRHGWYFHIEREFETRLRFLHAVVPVFRVDWMDANDSEKNFLDVTRYSFGVATFFLENLIFKLEFSLSDERGQAVSNNGFLTQLVFFW